MTKKVLLISGSAREHSTNAHLLTYIQGELRTYIKGIEVSKLNGLETLDIFHPQAIKQEILSSIAEEIQMAESVIISTPEYLSGIPALLKNMLEWLTESGELEQKKVILICYTPQSPRGTHCLQALQWTFKALHSQIIFSDVLHHDQIAFDTTGEVKHIDEDYMESFMEHLKSIV